MFPRRRPTLLTLTKACYLQGTRWVCYILKTTPPQGSCTASILLSYLRSTIVTFPLVLDPHVQKNYESSDPYSPLGLVVPRGVVPPWSDVFVEGQVDVIHGGSMMRSGATECYSQTMQQVSVSV